MKALNRIITALCALAIIPVFFLTDMITVRAEMMLTGSVIQENVSIKRAIDLFSEGGLLEGAASGELPEALLVFKTRFIVFAVFMVLAVLIALAIAVLAAATNCSKTESVLALAGLICIAGGRIAFSGISKAVAGGSVKLGDLFGSGWFDLLGDFNYLRLSTAPMIMTFLFIFIIIWTLSFVLISLDDNKQSAKIKNKKKKKG